MPSFIERDRVRSAGPEAQLVEVLEAASFDRFHLPAAKNIPLVELERAGAELDRSRPVIVYCHDTA